MSKIVYCNKEITDIRYSGYTITKAYACGGVPVYEKYVTDCDRYFTIVAHADGKICLHPTLTNTYYYSKDGGNTWTKVENGHNVPYYVDMSSGDSIMYKGELRSTSTEIPAGVAHIDSTIPSYEARGNVMSLIYGDNFRGQTKLFEFGQTFTHLFDGEKGLTSAENLCLPSAELEMGCYSAMFFDCENLTGAPQLPAMTLAKYCYQNMFAGCTSLTQAPELPATNLVTGCYAGMFIDCTNLETAPVLPATTLADFCYAQMFQDCPRLNNIICLATDMSANKPTENWTSGVSENGTFTKASGAEWTRGIDGIPDGWTVTTE